MTNELPPRTITAIDANASTVESLPITGCVSMMVGGTSNTAGAQLTFSVVFHRLDQHHHRHHQKSNAHRGQRGRLGHALHRLG